MSTLPILMYHNVCKKLNASLGLTIAVEKLESQFEYLVQNGFTTLHFSELETLTSIPDKSLIITFDDITDNQLLYAVPLLEKYNLKATFFIPFGYIGKSDLWNEGKESLMSIDNLKSLDSRIELALHSYDHKKYDSLSVAEINEDFNKCFETIKQSGLKVYNALAYPYGNYPKKEPEKSIFIDVLKQNNIKLGIRIGNKVNKFPFKNPFEVMRIDIKGEDTMFLFKLKVRFGKMKLF